MLRGAADQKGKEKTARTAGSGPGRGPLGPIGSLWDGYSPPEKMKGDDTPGKVMRPDPLRLMNLPVCRFLM